MKRLIVGGLAALAVALGVSAPAGADHCEPDWAPCHEFDWAAEYYEAGARHGIEMDISKVMVMVDACETYTWVALATLHGVTTTEAIRLATAAEDVCPGQTYHGSTMK